MKKQRAPYSPEFRRRMVELVRSGRSPEALSEEFEPSAMTIRNWVAKADIAENRRSGLAGNEKAELQELRRQNKILLEERDILKKAAAWFAQEAGKASSKRSRS
jgi:transposase